MNKVGTSITATYAAIDQKYTFDYNGEKRFDSEYFLEYLEHKLDSELQEEIYKNNRRPIHSIVWEAVHRIANEQLRIYKKSYRHYASSYQLKKYIAERTGRDFKEYLRTTVEDYTYYRENYKKNIAKVS